MPEDNDNPNGFPFRRDLVIATFDKASNTKRLYQVPVDVWKSDEHLLDENSELAAIMEPLLNAGTVLATVPVTNIQDGGASCYLLSLAGLDVDPFDLNED